ncbi:MAG: type I DNA topoisomerase [Phycisphaeraceae bacterium]|nr:type I DNA topoisomerase [Phycisphaeraceae bacterium]
MAKKKSKKTKKSSKGGAKTSASGKHLVIVESPAKARTINKYLGKDYVVKASVGHVRDLPVRPPKGTKQPVPGVDVDHGFKPTYEIIGAKKKTVTELKRDAKAAADVYLATDLDREGEAIAWHLKEALSIDDEKAKRVVFNAITQDEIRKAFENPRTIDLDKVNAQQARRILDRIVGYQVSPLLWKKVAGSLSAGRVQSVAVRLIAEREKEIQAFVPTEYWKIQAYFTPDLDQARVLAAEWHQWLVDKDSDGDPLPRTGRERTQWLNEHGSFAAELIEIDGKKAELADADQALAMAQKAGFVLDEREEKKDPKGKGPAARRIRLVGKNEAGSTNFSIESIETRRTTSRPSPPFITSTLQQAAANLFGFAAQTTMRTAQQLYEGIEVPGSGSVGLITYMRTDSTHLSGQAMEMARSHIESAYGKDYLPEKPNFYKSSNKAAQEAHEAIRPTNVSLRPDDPKIKKALNDQQLKLYRLIWQRFVACQMKPAQWDSTTVKIATESTDPKLTFKCNGRVLVFDGFYKVTGLPRSGEEAILPPLTESQPLEPLQIDPTQHFTNPPPRYSEASLVRTLESEGIGRPSTYASIIQVIQNRKYVEKLNGRFHCTDLGMVVTDKLVEAFPVIMDKSYTRQMEDKLDNVENEHLDWVKMLEEFYGPFQEKLSKAYEVMEHAKAATEPSPYECPKCGGKTVYRFSRNGRFLTCEKPREECDYRTSIDREGKPQEPEKTRVACPECGDPLMLRRGRFGPFLSCQKYPDCKGIVNLDPKGVLKHPKPPPLTIDLPCPKCDAPLNMRSSKRGPWLSCSKFPKCRGRQGWAKLDEETKKKLSKALEAHEKANPVEKIKFIDGTVVGDDYKPQEELAAEEASGE